MVWIRMVQESEATSETQQVYSEIMERTGSATILDSRKAMSLHPKLLRAVDGLAVQASRGQSGISHFREELIALFVSERVHCEL